MFELSTPKEITYELGQRLRTQRLAQNMSQLELALRTGLSESMIAKFEKTGIYSGLRTWSSDHATANGQERTVAASAESGHYVAPGLVVSGNIHTVLLVVPDYSECAVHGHTYL